ncbi:MAG: hypothetical protein RLO51_00670 [Thalassobaculum sp.]|uniref:hypothetical protein n=1 Tax=Thalassobaculum sp. TaxID=2022740 RepID=UPI0032EFC181
MTEPTGLATSEPSDDERKEAAKLILELALTSYVIASLGFKFYSSVIGGVDSGILSAAHKNLLGDGEDGGVLNVILWALVGFGYLRIYFGTHFVDYNSEFVLHLRGEPEVTKRREVILRFLLYSSSLLFVGALDKPYLFFAIFFGLVQISAIVGYILVMNRVLFAGNDSNAINIVLADLMYSISMFLVFLAAGGLIAGQSLGYVFVAFSGFFCLAFIAEIKGFYYAVTKKSIVVVCRYVNGNGE